MHVQWILGLIIGLKIKASAHHIPDLGFLAVAAGLPVVSVKTHTLA